MVFLLRRRSGVAPFGSLQKSSVRSALVLLARAAPRCLKSQKIPVGCIGCSRIQRTFAHFGRRHKAGISWPCSQLLHSLFFFESIRAGAENTGSKAWAQVRRKRARGARMGHGSWPAPGEWRACGCSLFVVIVLLTKESMRMSNGRSFSATENVEQDIQRQRAEGGHGDAAVGDRAHPQR